MSEYLDSDIAYLLGLIIGRGEIILSSKSFKIVINFPFRTQLEGVDQFPEYVKSLTKSINPRIESLTGKSPTIKSNQQDRDVQIEIEVAKSNLFARIIMTSLNNKLHYSEFSVPQNVKDSEDLEVVKEFVRGFADSAGNIRRSNRDQNGFHRVYLDVLNKNWFLPVNMCNLLQHKLEVPVSNVLWGHPNLREDSAFREHQIRVYAHDFVKIGFYVKHKATLLKALAKENVNMINDGKKDPSSFCNGCRRIRTKNIHPLENDERLPKFIRGKHFDSYWQICAECGCEYAIKCIEDKEQEKLPQLRKKK
jgi:hypothetical protein